MVTKKIKDINYYLNLPWTYSIKEDVDNKGKKIFIVGIEELPGIITDGYSKKEAFENLKEALEGTVELYKEMGDKIPEPKTIKKIQLPKNITYRTTIEQYNKITQAAKRKKLPINTFISEIINKALSKN